MNRASLRTSVAATTVGLAAALLTGCSTGSTSSDTTASEPTATTSAEADAFPVTIEHAFGETTIEEEPTRVATLGWTDHDHALALGVVPVGATKITWGGNAAGSSDWFDAALEEAGAEAPGPVRRRRRRADRRGRPARARPDPGDQLRHHRGGVHQAQQDRAGRRLPGVPVDDPVADVARDGRRGAGSHRPGRRGRRPTRRTAIDAAKEDYPELDGASLIYGYLTPADLSTVGIYAPQDPRVALLRDFGMVDADAVAGAIKEGEFYGTVSAERASELDSDVLHHLGREAR